MCEATAYLLKGGREEILLENVDSLENRGDRIKMVNIFGEEKEVKADLHTLSLVDHKILLVPK